MSLSKCLNEPPRWRSPALAALNHINSAAERVLSKWPDVVAEPPERDRDKLVADVLDRFQRNAWADTRMSLVTSAARALFDSERRDRPELAGLRQFYVEEIEASARQVFLGSMFSIYLGSFVQDGEHTQRLAQALTISKERQSMRWRSLMEKIPHLLSPKKAPKAIAALMSRMEDPWLGLKELGLRSPHAPGLMDHAHLEYLKLLQPELNGREAMEKLIRWLKPEQQEARASGSAEAISAIIQPWISKAPPPDDLKYLTENLVGLYGDPRVSLGVAWAAVPQSDLTVFMRWMTGENIRFFLDVVSTIERDVEDGHMWEPRRDFWLGLHNRGRIDAAWVAFSDKGARVARERISTKGSLGTLRFGHQTAGGSRIDTSLLILKIGKKIVVEGSHSYKVYVFDETNAKVPKLYLPRYDCEVIRLTDGGKAKSHQGDWQTWVLLNI